MRFIKKSIVGLLCLALATSSLVSFALEDNRQDNQFNLYYAFNSNSQFTSFMNRGVSDRVKSITFGWASLQPDEEGVLKLEYNSGDFRIPNGYEAVLKEARDNNVKVYLNIFYSGPYDNLLGSIEALTKDIQNLVSGSKVEGLSFDGVVIDLENLHSDDQTNFSAFVWFVNSALKRDDKEVYVALQPGRGTQYNILDKHTDGYIFMFHDYEPKYYSLPVNESKPVVTPLAPMDKVMDDLKNELDLISEEKRSSVMLQLNLATAQWKVKSGVIAGPGGERYPYRPTYESLVQRMAILEREDAQGFKRFEDGSPYLHYFDSADGTWNSIWYEDESSLKAKIEAAQDLGINNFSIWRMGNLPEISRYNLNIPKALQLIN